MATGKKKTKKTPKKNIDKLPSGRWRVRWTDEKGRRRSSTHVSEADARLALQRAQVEAEERRRGLRGLRPVDVRLADVWTVWRREIGERKRSQAADLSYWRNHLDPALAHLGVAEIDSAAIASFTRKQESKPELGDASVYHHLALLTTLLRFAQMKGWLDRVPPIKKPRIHLEDHDFRYLKSTDELERTLRAARESGPLVHMLYALPALSGLRLGEVCGLRRSDVDIDRRLITVRRSFDGPTKNGRVRQVPILDALLPLLRAWMASCETDLLFPNGRGGLLRRDSPYFKRDRYLGAVLERAGFARDYITYHGFRHTFASLWMMSGGELFRLQKILGHQSIRMTQRYAHLAPHVYAADYARLSLDLVVPVREVG